MSRAFSADGARVVALVAGSHFVNHAYFMLIPPVFAPLGTDLDVSLPAVALAASLVGGVVVALQLPLGYLSDTRGRTPVLALSLVLGAAGATLVATAQTYAWLLVGATVMGVGVAGHHPAHYPLLSAATDPATRGRAFSVHGFTGALGFAAPPAVVGGAAALGIGWRVAVGAIAAVGAVYAVVCLALVRWTVPREITRAPVTAEDRDPLTLGGLPSRLAVGLRSLASSTAILLLAVLWFLTALANWGIQAYTAELLVAGYGLPQGRANLLVAAMLVVGALAILAGGWLADRYDGRSVIVGGLAAVVALTLVMATGELPATVAAALTIPFIAGAKVSRPALSKLGDALSAEEDLGKNFGLLTIGISGGGAVAPYAYGVVIAATNVRVAFVTVAAVAVAGIAMTFVVAGASDRALGPTSAESEAATGED